MNNKEKVLQRIIDAVMQCCSIEIDGKGKLSITKDDVLGKSRKGNAVMTRCILVSQIMSAGFSVATASQLLNRNENTIRHLSELDIQYLKTSRAYRIASAEATLLCKNVDCDCFDR